MLGVDLHRYGAFTNMRDCRIRNCGFGLLDIYPIYISWFSHWYGPAARRLGGVVFSMASLGGVGHALAGGIRFDESE